MQLLHDWNYKVYWELSPFYSYNWYLPVPRHKPALPRAPLGFGVQSSFACCCCPGRFVGLYGPLNASILDGHGAVNNTEAISINLLAIPGEVASDTLHPTARFMVELMTPVEPGKPGAFQ